MNPCIESIITTSSRSAWSMRSRRISSFPCPTTRSSTEKVLSFEKCLETNGRSERISGPISGSPSLIQEKSCSLWDAEDSLDWRLLEHEEHQSLRRFVKDINLLYTDELALHQKDCDPAGFEWVDLHDSDQSVFSFLGGPKTDRSS